MTRVEEERIEKERLFLKIILKDGATKYRTAKNI